MDVVSGGFILVLFLLSVSVLGAGKGDGDIIMCIENERQALLTFKQSLRAKYDEGFLTSWNNKDCCRWKGIRCSKTSHHVIALHIHPQYSNNLQGSFTDALLDLHHLKILDLNSINFNYSKIPSFIGSLENLEHLILTDCYLSDVVSSQLGNLTKLKTLDLSSNYNLEVNSLDWLYHLPLLSRLGLSNTKVGDTNWLHAISSLPSLKVLDLSNCYLPQLTPSSLDFSVNSSFPSLTKVDLKYNNLTSSIFSWLVNFSSSLVSLDLRSNLLDGCIPEAFGNFILLEYLYLSDNRLDGKVPESFGNLGNLKFLDMSYNQLVSLPNLSGLISLRELHLAFNKLNGSLVDAHIGQLSKLEILDISSNMFDGNIFESHLSNLYKLNGSLEDAHIWQLSKLEILDVSSNKFDGNIFESHLSNLCNLKVMDLSFNSLALNSIATGWIPPFQLRELKLARCTVGPQFPKWIQTQIDISNLDLSDGGISGPVPEWLLDMPPKLKNLNLSYNQLNGSFPDLSSRFVSSSTIDISFNKFSGSLPFFHPNSTLLQLSTNMFTGPISSICTYDKLGLLDLSNNQLSGELPPCLMNMSQLFVLDLSNNTISGKFQKNLVSTFYMMQALVLRNNNLSGELPLFLKSQFDLSILDVGGNHLTGAIPMWLGTHLIGLKVLGLRDNKFNGMIPLELCHLNKIQILDLSGNNILGGIPWCFNNFTSLDQYDGMPEDIMPFASGTLSDGIFEYSIESYVGNTFVNWKRKDIEYRRNVKFLKLIDLSNNKLVGNIPKEFSLLRELISLNLSRNHLIGRIDPDIGQMEKLECLDLSGNHLSGEIPIGLGQLTFLSVLDLSNNNLSGSIPPGTQLRGFNASTYAGNKGLCGLPLAPCPLLAAPHISLTETQKHKYIDKGFYICAACGFVIGFWGTIVVFFFTSWGTNALINF